MCFSRSKASDAFEQIFQFEVVGGYNRRLLIASRNKRCLIVSRVHKFETQCVNKTQQFNDSCINGKCGNKN